jgi:hypothetical protein
VQLLSILVTLSCLCCLIIEGYVIQFAAPRLWLIFVSSQISSSGSLCQIAYNKIPLLTTCIVFLKLQLEVITFSTYWNFKGLDTSPPKKSTVRKTISMLVYYKIYMDKPKYMSLYLCQLNIFSSEKMFSNFFPCYLSISNDFGIIFLPLVSQGTKTLCF